LVADDLLQDVLDVLEGFESQLLVWGDTGGCFSEEEVIEHIESVSRDVDPLDVIEALESRVMLYRTVGRRVSDVCYRTRMGEAVHLFRNLRQWFHGQSIRESRSLVSDFRFLRRERSYPRRDKTFNELIDRLSTAGIDVEKYRDGLHEQVGKFSLANFQLRSCERILGAYERSSGSQSSPTGTIVCAGTGSGKTMAFYLPALAIVYSDVLENPDYRVRILAIYPRTELLKDQFNEAWEQSRKLNAVLRGKGGRPLKIGALFGDTPEDSDKAKNDLKNSEYLEHFLECSMPDCSGAMRWRREDIRAGVERLSCPNCGNVISGDVIALTRRSMKASPPDIVFTTTEMINIHLGNPDYSRLLGINSRFAPPIVLLDEAHIYEGNTGAQVAFLLRRWMHAVKGKPHFVGLSATLADAESFFEKLTGAPRSMVQVIEAGPDELVEEGAEYLLALRGDPVSQTALLSTTIQSAMLMRRILDKNTDPVTNSIWGTKTFIFVDDLDVTNRLYMQLADAEGWWYGARGLGPNRNGPLAALRNPDGANLNPRELRLYGQDWGMARQLGFQLDNSDRGRVSITSSQSAGVDSQSDLVVSTAKLEVGFNDPKVGAVIQHKAPRTVSSYLQRKGRAGRPRAMRPWTVVVLSDYGKDRIVYQHYEQLIAPEIRQQKLPIDNSHIHRMQACLSVLEWIGQKVGKSMWTVLNYPHKNLQVLPKIQEILQTCITNIDLQGELISHVARALGLSSEEVQRVFWQSPRSIILEFLPFLHRRVSTKWSGWSHATTTVEEWLEENKKWQSPVPEYIPDRLVDDLNVPTLVIELDRALQDDRYQGMNFFQGLKEFAPGRISKRFLQRNATSIDWLVPVGFDIDAIVTDQEIAFEVDDAFTSSRTDIGVVFDSRENSNLVVSQPHLIKVQSMQSSRSLADTTNSQLVWETVFREHRTPRSDSPPRGSMWTSSLKKVSFFQHRDQSQLEIVRYSTGANAEFKFKRPVPHKKNIRFVWSDKGSQAAIGTRLWVDAIKFEISIDDKDIQRVLEDKDLQEKIRLGFFHDGIRGLEVFKNDQFLADWIYECVIAAIALEMELSPRPIDSVVSDLMASVANTSLASIPRLILQTSSVHLNEESDDWQDGGGQLVEQLEGLLGMVSPLLSELKKVCVRLYEPLQSSGEAIDWCRLVLAKTIASASQSAISACLPNSDDRSIISDFIVMGEKINIYLSEQESGGSGVVSQLQEMYASDPVGLLNVFAKTMSISEYEQVNEDINSYLNELGRNEGLRNSLNAVRSASSFEARVRSNVLLRRSLQDSGFHLSHSFMAVLHSRVLRPGSNESTDSELRESLSGWDHMESALGFEIPMHIAALASVVRNHRDIDRAEVLYEKTCKLLAVLWPRGSVVRQNALQSYNRFESKKIPTERLLAESLCTEKSASILVHDQFWVDFMHAELEKSGRVSIVIPREKIVRLNEVIAQVQTTPFEAMGMIFYPRISGMNRHGSGIALSVDFAEAIH